ncbi:hypothetical protein [Neobacillus terrae]|uniref:hypothetical protein n=1 Tax=Neobacillus terrae TaxID=3034837 RepID=UPI00140C7C08|nr:hypothetical protein [Neobacillus terrae]NHM30744.1 hypothetical protein [Neobacillus terrae]
MSSGIQDGQDKEGYVSDNIARRKSTSFSEEVLVRRKAQDKESYVSFASHEEKAKLFRGCAVLSVISIAKASAEKDLDNAKIF